MERVRYRPRAVVRCSAARSFTRICASVVRLACGSQIHVECARLVGDDAHVGGDRRDLDTVRAPETEEAGTPGFLRAIPAS
jgi:hypothetical protein